MVSQGLERLEEQHEEKSKVQRTGDAAADAADMGEKHCCQKHAYNLFMLVQGWGVGGG